MIYLTKGFQLIELMIVCLIFFTIAGIGAGTVWNWIEAYRLENAFRLFSSQISEIRTLAIGLNFPITIEISDTRHKFGFAGRTEETLVWLSLPRGVKFTETPTKQVTFYPRGNAVPGGSYYLENLKGCVKIVVAPSGRIRWERLR